MAADPKAKSPRPAAPPPQSFWRRLAADAGRRLEITLGLLGWIYIVYTYWQGAGLGASLPTYAGF